VTLATVIVPTSAPSTLTNDTAVPGFGSPQADDPVVGVPCAAADLPSVLAPVASAAARVPPAIPPIALRRVVAPDVGAERPVTFNSSMFRTSCTVGDIGRRSYPRNSELSLGFSHKSVCAWKPCRTHYERARP